ncbi:unnamed protein product [Peniophora sp. CBMAI 1063]|nr:unnamed protein product [Peniophora sp. CBMAI 1063]
MLDDNFLATRQIRPRVFQLTLRAPRSYKNPDPVPTQVPDRYTAYINTSLEYAKRVSGSKFFDGRTRSKSTNNVVHHVRQLGGTASNIKDAMLLSLDAFAASADAFPPLKSVVSGLAFLLKQAQLVSKNVEAIYEFHVLVYDIIRKLDPASDELSPSAQQAIRILAEDLEALGKDMVNMAGHNKLLRFIRAQRDSEKLQDFTKRLEQINAAFTRSMLINADTKTTKILACVEPLREDIHRLSTLTRSLAVTLASNKVRPK